MIIRFLYKYRRLLLDILIIVALILAFTLFDPFGLFSPRAKLQNTANMVSQIKEIGELVTAEYYGEVIASLNETEVDLLQREAPNDSLYDDFVLLKYDMFEILLDNRDEKKKEMKKALEGYIKDHYDKGRNKKYISYILYLRQELLGRENNFKKRNKNKKEKQYFEEVHKYLFNRVRRKYLSFENDDRFYAYLNENIPIRKTYKDYLIETVSHDNKRENLTIIGRGWVKAGFRFNIMDEDRFLFEKENKTIHLFGMEPVILDTDINPWFIPQNRIPGYQIVSYRGRVDFKDAQRVKINCKKKLKDKAIEAELLKHAKENGVEVIKSFFSLLTGEEIEKVIFHHNDLDYSLGEIAEDSMVSFLETHIINDLVNNKVDEIEKLKSNDLDGLYEKRAQLLKSFLLPLKELKYGINGSNWNFNYYFAQANHIIEDGVIYIDHNQNVNQLKKLTDIRFSILKLNKDSNFSINVPPEIRNNDFWFSDSLSFISDYNLFIQGLYDMDLKVREIKSKALTENEYKNLIEKVNVFVLDSIKTGRDKYMVRWYRESHLKDTSEFNILEYQYAFDYNKVLIDKTIFNQKKVTSNDIVDLANSLKNDCYNTDSIIYKNEIAGLEELLKNVSHNYHNKPASDRIKEGITEFRNKLVTYRNRKN